MTRINRLSFQYQVRNGALARLSDEQRATARESRDRELEDYLGRLVDELDQLKQRVADLEAP